MVGGIGAVISYPMALVVGDVEMAVVTLLLGGRSSKTRYVITSRISHQVKIIC